MKESVVKSLMRLFAIVSQVHTINEIGIARGIIEDYLKLIVRKDKIRQYLIMYDFYHTGMREREIKTGDKQLSLFSVKAMIICEQANTHLSKKQKLFVLTYILEIISATGCNSLEDVDFIKTIATSFKIDENLFNDCQAFVLNKFDEIHSKRNVLFISKTHPKSEFHHLYREFLNGKIVFYYLNEINICLYKHIIEDDQLYINDEKLIVNSTYTFENGAVIKSPLLGSIYYNDIIKVFLHDNKIQKFTFAAKDLSYHFPNTDFGIESFNLSEESGQLIGIMGGSGVGKSTLLNLLNGNYTPSSGEVLLNGYNVHSEKDSLEGLIGYVPQDDLLIEELTVFQNLYFNTRLCFRSISKEIVLRKVNRLLHNLDLSLVKNMVVGSPLKKLISGGQRKRLNIALELIREPYVLFVDEPTSGLSSNDSDKVIDLLKHQSLKGKLVFVNIHQPSSDVFKQFDKLIVLDIGGRLAYQGNPQGSLIYLKKYNQLVNAEEGECPTCGNLNPEQILQILEAKKVNEFGDLISERQVDTAEWYSNYIKTQKEEISQAAEIKSKLPKIDFEVPSKFEQFKLFSIRNLLTKISDRQFLLINLLEAPVLAFVLSWFTKYNIGTQDNPDAYIFSGNINVPVYIFMGVVVSIFLGLMLSAEDIIRDRKILKREAFLNLSRFSYFNAKVIFLSLVLGIEIFLFTLIGNSLLQIKGMLFHYWLIFWISSLVAGLVGLNISATLKSVVSIYILIPLLLVPQILLGGAMIRFDKLNKKIAHSDFVPVVGDVMPSRWAFEALMVHQFTNNKYQRLIYEFEFSESNASYGLNYYIPALQKQLAEIKRIAMDPKQKVFLSEKIELFNAEMEILRSMAPPCYQNTHIINPDQFNVSVFSQIDRSLKCTREYYIQMLSEAIDDKDNRFYELERQFGGRDLLLAIKENYCNEQLANTVLNKNERQKVVVAKNKIIRKTEPIYFYPENKWGRAHFYAPVKRISNYYFDTYWFNIIILFLMALVFYLSLLLEIFPLLYEYTRRKRIDLVLQKAKRRVFNLLRPILK